MAANGKAADDGLVSDGFAKVNTSLGSKAASADVIDLTFNSGDFAVDQTNPAAPVVSLAAGAGSGTGTTVQLSDYTY